MNEPIKIIHKYNNANNHSQYHIYIFVGDIADNILEILQKFKETDFYNTLNILTVAEYNILAEYYGSLWYNKFFNIHHLVKSINEIKTNANLYNALRDKYSTDWYSQHIEPYVPVTKKIKYSYKAVIRNEYLMKEKKRKRMQYLSNKEKDERYETNKKRTYKELELLVGPPKLEPEDARTLLESIQTSEETGLYKEYLDSQRENQLNKYYGEMELTQNGGMYDTQTGAQNGTQSGGANKLEVSEDDFMFSGDLDTSDEDLFKNDDEDDDDDDDDIDIDTGNGALFKIDYDNTEEDIDVNTELEADPETDEDPDNDEAVVEEYEEEIQQEKQEEDVNLDEIYQNLDEVVDTSAKKHLEAINHITNEIAPQLIPFDKRGDNAATEMLLENVFYKNYVTSQYIYKDDTIKDLKSKITCSFLNNDIFGPKPYIIPSRMYLWAEYIFENEINYLMIGQKWINNTTLLNIDIIPNPSLRVYENLEGRMSLLSDQLRRGSKIKREDEDNCIYYDYDKYINNDEIYMIDIYNELTPNYQANEEKIKNMMDTYFKLYFPKIKQSDVISIIDYLNKKDMVESQKIVSTFESIYTDLILDNYIVNEVEKVKKTDDYKVIFKGNYLTQCVIHLNTHIRENVKLNLYRIFDDFVVDGKYPFIQYHTLDKQTTFKYDEKVIMNFGSSETSLSILAKWFENLPYGISVKIDVSNPKDVEKRYMGVNILDTGRIEYKTQWKETDNATLENVKATYQIIRDLLNKINSSNPNIYFSIPEDSDFIYAFINSIQNFDIPGDYYINHNDLSEFSRNFYPYVVLIVDPKKRVSNITSKQEDKIGKYGTYLRYKRISKYENIARIEQRILYIMRNYEVSPNILIEEISKQFNTTIEIAKSYIDQVRAKYPNIKKSRRILKKITDIPKNKPPGIEIDIQGKRKDKYKIRISGTRNQLQLQRIVTFLNVMLFMYYETYIIKKPERRELIDKVKKLTKIAKRRNKVVEYVTYDTEIKELKKKKKNDSERIGYKTQDGHSLWPRDCQNNGQKRRQPNQYLSVDELSAKGYTYNSATGFYEKVVQVKTTTGNDTIKVIIRVAELPNGNEMVYYTCEPENNGDYVHIGFLTKSNNPYGKCSPCCFKKDFYLSNNLDKKDFFMKCLGKTSEQPTSSSKSSSNNLYILQGSNKIQEDRLSYLPNSLDIFCNLLNNNTAELNNHYLVSTNGYYFKFGTNQLSYQLMNSIASTLGVTNEFIRVRIVELLKEDTNNVLFSYIDEGEIRMKYKTKENYINQIENNPFIQFNLYRDLLAVPGIFTENGLNVIIFKNQTYTPVGKFGEQWSEEISDYTLDCLNNDNIYNIQTKENNIILKDGNNYYPIIHITKHSQTDPNGTYKKVYTYKDDPIMKKIYELYSERCGVVNNSILANNSLTAFRANRILSSLAKFKPKCQVLDVRYKCIFIITSNNFITPVNPSQCIYNLAICETYRLDNLNHTIEVAEQLHKLTPELMTKPIGVYYSNKNKDNIEVIGIITNGYNMIPIKHEYIKITEIKTKKLFMEYMHVYVEVDDAIKQKYENGVVIIDDRIRVVSTQKYKTEGYELFRYTISYLLHRYQTVKTKLFDLFLDSTLDRITKRNYIRKILFKVCNRDLYNIYIKHFDTSDKYGIDKIGFNDFVYVIQKEPVLDNYTINNIRTTCEQLKPDQCAEDLHCGYKKKDGCKMAITAEDLILFINKLADEICIDKLKAAEIFNIDEYFVSDIVDNTVFTIREGQTIIKSSSQNIASELKTIFGKEDIPIVGKRKIVTPIKSYLELNQENQIVEMNNYYIQNIIPYNMTIYRAFANGYYWYKQNIYETYLRNLGYYSGYQTTMANFFHAKVIDFIQEKKNKNLIKSELKNYSTNLLEMIKSIIADYNKTSGIVELFVLHCIYGIDIHVYNKADYRVAKMENKILIEKLENAEVTFYDPNKIHIKNFTYGTPNPINVSIIYPKSL